ncbi:MAG: helix-turn-helix transcriptional regulator [Actinomycetota bacterium]|nr:helix-turn-helix transcriptional regulator [Actinomycetota bacterium]
MTIANGIVPSSMADGEGWFNNVGTTSPTVALRPRKFIACALMAGCAATGTVTAVTPADAVALSMMVTQRSTLPALPAEPTAVPDDAVVPAVLQRLRQMSGLSWGDLGRALGVSRRTIHNWLGDARVAGVHLRRLLELSRLVDRVSTGSPESTRALLLQPTASGRSIIDDLALTARPTRRRPLSTISVGDLIAPKEDTESASLQWPQRRSSLRGGSLPTRRPDPA